MPGRRRKCHAVGVCRANLSRSAGALKDRLTGRDIDAYSYYFVDPAGVTFELRGSLNPTSTVAELKAKAAEHGYNADEHAIKFKKTILNDDSASLADLGIKHDMKIVTVPKPMPKAKAKAKVKGKAKSKSISAVGGDAGDID